MSQEIQLNLYNEYGGLQNQILLDKEKTIQYLQDNLEDIVHLNIVRKFAKVFKEETANPLSYTRECTTIEKEDIEGNTSKIEFCPFDILGTQHKITERELRVIASPQHIMEDGEVITMEEFQKRLHVQVIPREIQGETTNK